MSRSDWDELRRLVRLYRGHGFEEALVLGLADIDCRMLTGTDVRGATTAFAQRYLTALTGHDAAVAP